MNIFKILANGDGSINEPNVSAFLGYLLNPYSDHGLGFEFLESFLKHVEIQEENFNPLKYDYEIFFEQAFKEEDKSKQIVDIVILCINNDFGNKKESFVKSILSNDKKVEYIFLIENKIKKASKKSNQLKEQLDSTIIELSKIPELKIDNNKIYSIYITPKEETLINEFEMFKSSTKKHIYWKDEDKTNNSALLKILKDIIEKEAKTEIEAINEYTKHTIKSFIQFIENDFKSEKQEQKERKNDGTYTKEYVELNQKTNIEEKLSNLREELIKKNKDFIKILSAPNFKDKRHPKLLLSINKIKIQVATFSKNRDHIRFGFIADNEFEDSISILRKIAKQNKIQIKNEKNGAYCKTEEMNAGIKIEDFETIYKQLEKTIKLTII